MVVALGLSPKYVLDEMQMYEVESLLESYYLKNKDSWEQARLIAYMTAQVNSRDRISPEDIMKFSWEKNNENIEFDENDLKELESEMKQMENIMNNKA